MMGASSLTLGTWPSGQQFGKPVQEAHTQGKVFSVTAVWQRPVFYTRTASVKLLAGESPAPFSCRTDRVNGCCIGMNMV